MAKRALTDKQRKFSLEYLVDLNATQAAIRAGYSKKTANRMGSENLSKPVIRDEIQKQIREQSKRTEVTINRVLEELAIISFFDPASMYDENGKMLEIHKMPENVRRAIGGITLTSTKKIIKIIDKRGSLELLGRHLAMFLDRVKLEDTREEFTGDDPEKYIKDAISQKNRG